MLCDLPKVAPKSNIIKCCRKVFKKRRTVIGTKFIPPYSNQFMAELEEGVLRKAELKTYLQWKYIDDTLFLWKYGEEKLSSFINANNKTQQTIKVTAELSETSINFLEITASIAEGVIQSHLHVKPTDSHQYLLSSSCHPFYYKNGIPYLQALTHIILQDDISPKIK